MNHQAEIDALVADESARRAAAIPSAGDKAQAAFLNVAQTASELTTEGLPPGKTVAEALQRAVARRDDLWLRSDLDEDERIDELTKFCTRLYAGNELAGKLLASVAIWS